MILTTFSVAAGLAIILFAVRDIFLTMFAPASRGVVSPLIMRSIWRMMRPLARRRHRYRELAGPTIFVAILTIWATMIVIGFALIYWAFLPDHFLLDFGLDVERDRSNTILTSLYFSLVALTTLGFGDIIPTSTLLRMIVPLEALIGFGLLTAGISYFLSINPALSRRRVLAHEIAGVREVEAAIRDQWDNRTSSDLFHQFANELTAINSDQIQLPITYYFLEADPSAELAAHLPYLLSLVRRERDQHQSPAEHEEVSARVPLNEYLLERSIVEYVTTVNRMFLRGEDGDVEKAMHAFAQDRE